MWVSHGACCLLGYDTIVPVIHGTSFHDLCVVVLAMVQQGYKQWYVVIVVSGIIMELIKMMGIIAGMVSCL